LNTLQDIITYVRRIIKAPSNAVISDNLIIDYINRFWIMDVDARIQLFDLKTTYQFQTVPGQINYNMPLYNVQTEPTGSGQTVASFPVYQGFENSCYVNGIEVPFYTQKHSFNNIFPLYIQSLNPATTGDGGSNYTLTLPFFPAIPGHIDITGIQSYINKTGLNQDPPLNSNLAVDSLAPYSGNSVIPITSVQSAVFFTATNTDGNTYVIQDSGQFYRASDAVTANLNYGLLMTPGNPPYGCVPLNGGYSTSLNTVNYATGVANITFTDPSTGLAVDIDDGVNIQAQCYFYNPGLPRGILYYNNTLTILPAPNISYLVSLEAYLSPAAFLSTSAGIPFGYMAEYIARGAARKILSDTGDVEQFQFYEPLFLEQERLVWKRSQRQFTATRTQTLFSESGSQGSVNALGQGSGT